MSQSFGENAPDVSSAMNEAAQHSKNAEQLNSMNQDRLPDTAKAELGYAIRHEKEQGLAARARAEDRSKTATAAQIRALESQRAAPAPEQSLTIGGSVESSVNKEVEQKREAEIAKLKQQMRDAQDRMRDSFDRAR